MYSQNKQITREAKIVISFVIGGLPVKEGAFSLTLARIVLIRLSPHQMNHSNPFAWIGRAVSILLDRLDLETEDLIHSTEQEPRCRHVRKCEQPFGPSLRIRFYVQLRVHPLDEVEQIGKVERERL